MIYASAHVYVALIQSNRPTHFLPCITDNPALNQIYSSTLKTEPVSSLNIKIESSGWHEISARYFAALQEVFKLVVRLSALRMVALEKAWFMTSPTSGVQYPCGRQIPLMRPQYAPCRDSSMERFHNQRLASELRPFVGVYQNMQENNAQNLPASSINHKHE